MALWRKSHLDEYKALKNEWGNLITLKIVAALTRRRRRTKAKIQRKHDQNASRLKTQVGYLKRIQREEPEEFKQLQANSNDHWLEALQIIKHKLKYM